MKQTVYIDPEIAELAEAEGITYPDPNSDEFEDRIIELINEESPWARQLQDAVIIRGVGDPRELKRSETIKQTRLRKWSNRLFKKQDPDTGEHFWHRDKLFFLGVAAVAPFIVGFLGLTALSTRSPQPTEAASPAPSLSASAQEIDADVNKSADPDIMEQVRGFGVTLDETLSKDSDLVGVSLTGELETEEPTEAAISGLEPAPAEDLTYSGSGYEAVPAASAVISQRERKATPGVVLQRLKTPTENLDDRKPLSSAIVAVSRREPTSTAYNKAAVGSGLVSSSKREVAETSLESEVLNQTVEQPTRELPEQTPEVATPALAQSPVRSGDELDGALEVGVLTAEGSTVPTLVRTDEGMWQGSATLNAVGRIEVSLSEVTVDGVTYPVDAKVFGEDGFLGVDATIREETPALAADLITAGLRGVSDYVTDLADSATVISNNDQVIVNDQAVPLEWALAGSLADLFSPAESKRAVVRVAEITRGKKVSVRVF